MAICKDKGHRLVMTILRKKKLGDFKTYYKVTTVRTVNSWHKYRHTYKSWKHNKEHRKRLIFSSDF